MSFTKESLVGVFVLIGLLCVAYLTIKLGRMEVFSSDGYVVTARFSSVAGLRVGANVEIAGVPIGRVSAIRLDPATYSADVDLRKLLSLGMKFKSSSAILAHNHPSGVALPSQDDLQTTRVIAKALASVGVHLIDHIIVADGDYVSLADSGILADLRE